MTKGLGDVPAIRSIEDVVRSHVQETLAQCYPAVPQYRIAIELGISPVTLIRMRKRWETEKR